LAPASVSSSRRRCPEATPVTLTITMPSNTFVRCAVPPPLT
jgi:hypothetical protein